MAEGLSMRDCQEETLTHRDDIPLKAAEMQSDDDEKQVYPRSAQLAPILIALCFQSFCIALVRSKLFILDS